MERIHIRAGQGGFITSTNAVRDYDRTAASVLVAQLMTYDCNIIWHSITEDKPETVSAGWFRVSSVFSSTTWRIEMEWIEDGELATIIRYRIVREYDGEDGPVLFDSDADLVSLEESDHDATVEALTAQLEESHKLAERLSGELVEARKELSLAQRELDESERLTPRFEDLKQTISDLERKNADLEDQLSEALTDAHFDEIHTDSLREEREELERFVRCTYAYVVDGVTEADDSNLPEAREALTAIRAYMDGYAQHAYIDLE